MPARALAQSSKLVAATVDRQSRQQSPPKPIVAALTAIRTGPATHDCFVPCTWNCALDTHSLACVAMGTRQIAAKTILTILEADIIEASAQSRAGRRRVRLREVACVDAFCGVSAAHCPL